MISKFLKFVGNHELFTYRVVFILLFCRVLFLEQNSGAFILEFITAITVMFTSVTSMIQESKSLVKEIKETFLSEDN